MKTAVVVLLMSLVSCVRGGKMFGLCYTPYRVFGVCPTDAEVEADVQILMHHTSRVRVYSTECINVNKILLRHASQGDFSILLGVYLDNRPTDQQEVDFLIEALREYPYADIAGIVVGNEVLYRNTLPKSFLIQRIQEVRGKVRALAQETGSETLRTTPIYAVEIFPDPDIAAVSDVLGLNIHPFYRPDLVDSADPEIMSDNILEVAKEQIALYSNMMPEKTVVVTEIGWPTQSDPTEMHHGDSTTAIKFLHKFTDYCEAAGIFYYWFEAFDSPWKKPMFPTNQATMSEFNFGMYYSDRVTPKEIPEDCMGCDHTSPPPPIEYQPSEQPFGYQHDEPVDTPLLQEPESFPQIDTFTQEPDTTFTEDTPVTFVGETPTAYIPPTAYAESNVFAQSAPDGEAEAEAYSQATVYTQDSTQPYRRLLVNVLIRR